MAAIIEIVGIYGDAPGEIVSITSHRYCTANRQDSGVSYPNNVPPAGELYRSYWAHTGLRVVGGKYSRVWSFRLSGPRSIKRLWKLGTGCIQVALRDDGYPAAGGDHGCPYEEYAPPTGVEGQYGYDIKDPVDGHPYYKGQVKQCIDFDKAKFQGPGINIVPFDRTTIITPDSSSKITKFAVHQLILGPDTERGPKAEISGKIHWREK